MKNNNFEWTKENPGIIAVAGGGYVLKLLENNFEWTKDVIPTASQAVLEVYRAERRHRKNMRRCRWLIDDLAKDNVVIPTRKYQKKILIKESDLIIALRRDQDVERDQCLQITAMESGFIRNANAQNFHEMLTDVLQHIVGEL
ncbi:MAG: hypothetical protein Q8K86_09555, partial [Candidatus Nanopelagicaceae bacterium]|nr:hypothetical protein [Candidatus Nanopelagicaceae bacterium]